MPVVVAALNALQLGALTQPASNMLNTILGKLPAIFASILVLIIAYVIERVVAGLITNLLGSVGFDSIMARLGIGKKPSKGEKTPSGIVGFLILVAIISFAVMQSFEILGFAGLAALVSRFLVFAGHIVVGLAIFGIGLYLSDLASNVIRSSSASQAGLLAFSARVSILILSVAMALR